MSVPFAFLLEYLYDANTTRKIIFEMLSVITNLAFEIGQINGFTINLKLNIFHEF